MSQERFMTWTCDLCLTKAKQTSKDLPPKGWIEIAVENIHIEREFINKDLCFECRALISNKS